MSNSLITSFRFRVPRLDPLYIHEPALANVTIVSRAHSEMTTYKVVLPGGLTDRANSPCSSREMLQPYLRWRKV